MAHSVVVKKEEKVKHIFDLLGDDLTEENFKEKFKSIYPKDWQRIISTYNIVELRIKKGDKYALKIIKALVYQVSKEIGGISTVLYGKVDGIVLTGGLANWSRFVEMLKERVSHLGEILLYPGENEMESLAFGVMRCIEGSEKIKIYEG